VIPAAAAPLLDIDGLLKASAPIPLRLARLVVAAGDRLVLSGFDRPAAELFVHLVTGAAVPDEGRIRIAGRDTREIATDTEWLASLDRFGLVTDRAVLVDGLSVEANLALPLTLSVDPVSDVVRAEVRGLARDVGLDVERLSAPAGSLAPAARALVHLARALATGPRLLLLEHPTASLPEPGDARSFGATLRRVAASRHVGWIALSNDRAFAGASHGRRLRLDRRSGRLAPERGEWMLRWFEHVRLDA